MPRPDPRDHDGNPICSGSDFERGSMAPFWLTALAAIALMAMLSPSVREVPTAPVVYAEAIAPGPNPIN